MKIFPKFLLSIYFIAFAASPLSYIHIEDELVTASFVSSHVKFEENLHLFLHELFFAHFGDKNDHINNRSLESASNFTEKKDRPKFYFELSLLKYPSGLNILFPSFPNLSQKFVSYIVDLDPLSDYRTLLSDSSPPSV